jgi:outer membrane protein
MEFQVIFMSSVQVGGRKSPKVMDGSGTPLFPSEVGGNLQESSFKNPPGYPFARGGLQNAIESKTTIFRSLVRVKTLAAISCLLLMLFSAALARAADAPPTLPLQPLTLNDATAFALTHNRGYLAARQEVDSVGQQVRQAKADFYPKLDLGYVFRSWKDAPYAVFDEMQFQIAPQSVNRWDLQLNQPIFTGFALSSQLNISKMNLKIAEYRLDETRLNTVRDVERAFWNVLLGQKLLLVARDNVSSLEVQRRNAQANFDQGLVAQNDVLRADVALAQARQRERTATKQLTLLRSRLNQILDIDLQTALTLYEEEIRMQEAPSLERLNSLADERRPEYLSLEASIRQTAEGITAARSRYYPRLSGFAIYYREGNDFLANNNPFSNDHNAAVGLRVDWNWFEGGKTDAMEKEYKYRQKALEEKHRELKQQIHLQVEDSYEQLGVARENLSTARAALKQAEENERMTTIQYREQLVIFLEVLNAQVLLSQSRVDYYDALYGFKLAWADLERAVGGPFPEDLSPQKTPTTQKAPKK